MSRVCNRDSIRVTTYSLHREGVKKTADRSYYTDKFNVETASENSKGWKPIASAYLNEETKQVIYLFEGTEVDSEEKLIELLNNKLSEKRAKLTKTQNEYIKKCRAILADPANKEYLHLLGINIIIEGASVGTNKDGFMITQHWANLPSLQISPKGEILEVYDSYQGIAY